jgi:hypothetical protein
VICAWAKSGQSVSTPWPVFLRREFRYDIVYVSRNEQGVARRPMKPKENFPPGIMVQAAV